MGLADFLQISENPRGTWMKRAARAWKRACAKGHKITWKQALRAFKSGRLKADGTLSKTSKRKTSKCKSSKRKTSKRKTSKRKTSKRKSSKRKTSKRKTSKRKSSKRR